MDGDFDNRDTNVYPPSGLPAPKGMIRTPPRRDVPMPKVRGSLLQVRGGRGVLLLLGVRARARRSVVQDLACHRRRRFADLFPVTGSEPSVLRSGA